MRVLLAGGGTGGHINPALAIASIIKAHEPDSEFLFAGTPNGMEMKLVPQAGYKVEPIKVAGFQRKLTIKNIQRNIKALCYLTTAGHRAKQIINGFKPDVVIGTGGYVSGPIVMQATKMGIPTLIHEQNAYPGITNKLLARKVSKVMLTVKEALEYFEKQDGEINYTVTGLPVRPDILGRSKRQSRQQLGFDDALCILSFGGSLGAGCINSTMTEAIKWHVGNGFKINHIHGYGGMGKESVPQALEEAGIPLKSNRLRVTEYINDMDVCLSASDLVICRAGASTLAELEACGKASILIPSPNVAGNHQFYNAKVLEKAGAAIVIEQKDVTNEKIIEIIKDIYNNPAKLARMSENAKKLYIPDTDEKIWQSVCEAVNSK